MADLLRESALGQIIRLVTKRRFLKYPEEESDFEIPWKNIVADKDLDHERPSRLTPHGSLHMSRTTSLAGVATTQSTDELAPVTSRTRTRDQTAPYSVERYDIEKEEDLQREQSSIIVPQKTKDGVTLVDWYTTDDPANPQNWSSPKKAYVGFQIFIYTFVVYCGSAIYTSSEPGIMQKFHVSQSKASLGLSMYVIGYGLGPMIFSPLSEVPLLGRNVPYMTSFALFVVLSVPTALVDNYPGLLVLRFLTGFMGSPCLATGGATMQDLYSLIKLPYALAAWVAAAFSAPALGPLLSGFAVMAKGWRWSLWEILWMSGPVFVVWVVTMPETSTANILLRRAARLRQLTGDESLKSQSEIDQGNKNFSTVVREAVVVPIMIFLKDPAVFFANVYTSLIYGIYYSFFEAFPLVYIGEYNFNIGELGIVFICIIVGCVLGIIVYCSYVWFYLEPDIVAHGLRPQEHRLVPALFAVFAMPAGLFWFGWTARSDIHWIVSILGITLYAFGAFVLFQCIFMYLPLTYPQYAASLFAANDLCRSALAAGSIIFARPLYVNLGIGRGISILGGLMVGGVFGIWTLYFVGARLRARSRFAMS